MLDLSAKVCDSIEYLSPVIVDADLGANSATNDSALATWVAFATSPPLDLATKLSFVGFCQTLTVGKDTTSREKYPTAYTEVFSFLCDTVTGKKPSFGDQIYTPRQQKSRLTLDSLKTRSCGRTFQDLKAAFKPAVLNRRLCWTKKGHLGLVHRFAKLGHCVVVAPGAVVPFILRQAVGEEGDLLHRLVGESYIDGIMHGEVMSDDEIELTELHLV